MQTFIKIHSIRDLCILLYIYYNHTSKKPSLILQPSPHPHATPPHPHPCLYLLVLAQPSVPKSLVIVSSYTPEKELPISQASLPRV